MKTAAILLVAVTLSTSLFLQSSAAPDTSGLSSLLRNLGNKASTAITSVGSAVEGTVGALVGKGVRTCPAYVLFLKEFGVVLLGAQKRLKDLLTDCTKKLDKDIANACGPRKELLTKINALLKVVLKALSELLKDLVAIVANPTHKGLNKLDAAIKQLKQLSANLIQIVQHGIVEDFLKILLVAIHNALEDAVGALDAVSKAQRRSLDD